MDKAFSVKESMDTLKNLQSFLESRGIQFALFDTYQNPQKYSQIYAQHSINYLPLNIPFKDEYTFGSKDGHSTQAGHQAIADSLYNRLKGIVLFGLDSNKTSLDTSIQLYKKIIRARGF
jgi:hypothetical protein